MSNHDTQRADDTNPTLPAPSCVIYSPEEISRHILQTCTDVRDIKTALLGSKLQPNGMLPRLENVETKVSEHDRQFLRWGAGLAALGTAATLLKDRLGL